MNYEYFRLISIHVNVLFGKKCKLFYINSTLFKSLNSEKI